MGYNGTNRPSVGSNRQVREIGEITAAPNLNSLTPLIKGEERKGSGGIQPPTTPSHGVSGFEQTDTHHRSKDESPAKRAIAPNRGYISGFGCI
jgi:hypothetical protein